MFREMQMRFLLEKAEGELEASGGWAAQKCEALIGLSGLIDTLAG
jgi:hypothetical protein